MTVDSNNTSIEIKRIKLLDNRLANQIAAGEVVERPSSVVKELVENSIDAGASKIEVDIERGGTRLIRVTDNGKGIHQDDLTLSLTRHATSKISTTSDLGCIQSLGFRGEALASISAVSKLSLTSRTHDSDLAWQAIAQGRDMVVDVQPAAAAPGTRIEVADLFFNTPARQKFLRTEKTEFNHIEEIFSRHALANFGIAFLLKHNNKIIKRVPACAERSQYLKRIATICGKPFAENCVSFECQHESIQLFGWLGKPDFHRSESDIQYVYINGRPVKDKTLNHAIRQSYDGLLPPGRMATFVIFLNMDPAEVDVNVHPTKHEVRFGEQRLVHDLLAKSIRDSISDCYIQQHFVPEVKDQNDQSAFSDKYQLNRVSKPYSVQERKSYSAVSYQTRSAKHSDDINGLIQKERHTQAQAESSHPINWLKLENNLWITVINDKTLVIDGSVLLSEFLTKIVSRKQPIKSKALLFPHRLTIDPELLEEQAFHLQLEKLGFISEPVKNENRNDNQILIKQIPCWLVFFQNQWIFEKLPGWFENSELVNNVLVNKVSQSIQIIPDGLISLLIDEMGTDLLSGESARELTADYLGKLFV